LLPRRVLGRAFAQFGRIEEGIACLEEGLSTAVSEEDIARFAAAKADVLADDRRGDQAREVIAGALQRVSNADAKVTLLRSFARIDEPLNPNQESARMAAYEEALRYDPYDTSLRFDAAYKYGELRARRLALYHYRRLLESNPEHEPASNNAGVSAQSLGLPILAVDYFMKAQSLNSTLAMSNLASRLLEAGFRSEAEELLEEARQHEEPDRRVTVVTGEIGEALDKEEGDLESAMKDADYVSKLMALASELSRSPTDAEHFRTGEYKGTPCNLGLAIQQNGQVTGSFVYSINGTAKLNGQLRGSVLWFDWSIAPTSEKGLLAAFQSSSGFGLLIGHQGGLEGFFADGPRTLDPSSLKRWSLQVPLQ
jgi:tetratricopeptide (TPR) repeat protein